MACSWLPGTLSHQLADSRRPTDGSTNGCAKIGRPACLRFSTGVRLSKLPALASDQPNFCKQQVARHFLFPVCRVHGHDAVRCGQLRRSFGTLAKIGAPWHSKKEASKLRTLALGLKRCCVQASNLWCSLRRCRTTEEGGSSSSSSWFSQLRHTVTAVLSDLEPSDDIGHRPPGFSSGESSPTSGMTSRVRLSEATILHSTGSCNPCVLLGTKRGCIRGNSCRYCHLEHTEKLKVPKRPRKQTRDKYKMLVVKLLAENEDLVCQTLQLQRENTMHYLVRTPL